MGCWLTKRRSILFAPFFTVALLASRWAGSFWLEAALDLAGFACILGGTWLRLTAASYHEGSHQNTPITAGPYAWVRHPLYLANLLLGLGIVLMTGWWPMIVVYILIFFPIHAIIARSEEVHLTELYGPQYPRYRQKVFAILPLRKFPGPYHGTPNSFKLKKGKEYQKTLGYAAAMAALLLFKLWRKTAALPAVPAIAVPVDFLAFAAAVLAIIFRPKIQWRWLRAGQTVIAVVCIVLLVVQIPGVWIRFFQNR